MCLNVSTEMSVLEGQQEDCSKSKVPVLRNCGCRKSSWFVEQTVDQSARIDTGG